MQGNSRGSTWSHEDDDRLRKAVADVTRATTSQSRCGKNLYNWTAIAKQMPNRSNAQCSARWRNHVDPSINHELWSEDELCRLKALVELQGREWANIAKTLSEGCTYRRTGSQAEYWFTSIQRKDRITAKRPAEAAAARGAKRSK